MKVFCNWWKVQSSMLCNRIANSMFCCISCYKEPASTCLKCCVSTNRKEFKLHTDFSGLSEQKILYNSLVRRQSSSYSPSLSSCLSSGNHPLRLIQKTIEGFDCKVNGRARGAALLRSLGVSDGRAAEHRQRAFPSRQQSFPSRQLRPRPARLRKMCRHSCDTDFVREPKRF